MHSRSNRVWVFQGIDGEVRLVDHGTNWFYKLVEGDYETLAVELGGPDFAYTGLDPKAYIVVHHGLLVLLNPPLYSAVKALAEGNN